MVFNFEYYWQKIKEGDERSFEYLFKKTYPLLCYYSRQITHDNHLSKEIVQDILQKIWQDREIIIVHSSFKAYLFQSVRNQSLNELKKKKTKKSSVNRILPDEIWQYVLENTEADDHIIESLTYSDTAKIIEDAIESLPPRCRTVFKLSRLNEISNDEISSLLNISINTVRAHIYTALSKISESLQKGE